MVVGPVIAAYGWRGGSLAIAALILCVALPAVGLMLPNGATRAPREAQMGATGMALREALCSRRFIQTAAAFFLLGLGITALIVHLVPLLTDRGLSPLQAVHTAAWLGFAVMAGRIIVGMLVDRYHAPFVGFVFLLLPVVSCLLLLNGLSPLLAVLLLGLAAGAEIDLLAYLVARQFGMRAYGEIYGWALSIFSLGAGLGPVLAGVAYDRHGSYDFAIVAAAGLVLTGAAAIAMLGRFPAYASISASAAR